MDCAWSRGISHGLAGFTYDGLMGIGRGLLARSAVRKRYGLRLASRSAAASDVRRWDSIRRIALMSAWSWRDISGRVRQIAIRSRTLALLRVATALLATGFHPNSTLYSGTVRLSAQRYATLVPAGRVSLKLSLFRDRAFPVII